MSFKVMSEQATLYACSTMSIGRLGDGELNCAIGRGCSSQVADPKLAKELTAIMQRPQAGLLVGVPNFDKSPRAASWAKWREGRYAHLYTQPVYASSLITRPDSAPWIDTPEYWNQVRSFWGPGKDIVLVVGDEKSITREMMPEARSVRIVKGPRQHAYAEIDRIEEEIGKPTGSVIMCLGATATVLAARLSRKGVHALDFGHMGLYLKHAGAYAYSRDDLASRDYRKILQKKHGSMRWGNSGASHAPVVIAFAKELGAKTVCDYGCGSGSLKPALPDLKTEEYDPGIKGKDLPPKPADLVVASDVFEHIEPEKINRVVRHTYQIAKKGAYFVIALREARETLADGRNAHLLIKKPEWWLEVLKENGWTVLRHDLHKNLHVWCLK